MTKLERQYKYAISPRGRAYRAAYLAENRARTNSRQRSWYARNKKKMQIWSRLWRVSNAAKIAERRRSYRRTVAVKAKEQAYRHSYYLKNKHKTQTPARKEYMANYVRNKLATDVLFKLKANLRCRVRAAFKYACVSKKDKFIDLIGCTALQLKQHLESTFTEGMSWAVSKQMHVDHIKPCCSFDLSDPEEQKRCFHYTNLRFLWATDNRQKISKDRAQSIRRAA